MGKIQTTKENAQTAFILASAPVLFTTVVVLVASGTSSAVDLAMFSVPGTIASGALMWGMLEWDQKGPGAMQVILA
jgi:hypothetical protein